MANIVDYLTRRTHYTLEEVPFNEVDSLILSQLAYGKMEKVADFLPGRAEALLEKLRPCYSERDQALLSLFAEGERFGGSVLFAFESKLSEAETLQFAAVTFLLSDGTAYVSFRGTDNTLVGWKEDLNLSFTSPIPAQAEAVSYLTRVNRALGCPMRVGGHSKGGNLAVYAAAHCENDVRSSILEIYNNDGPGHSAETVESEGYKSLQNKIQTYIPKCAVVGLLLEHSKNYRIVDSDAHGLFQHDPYSWLVDGDEFAFVRETSLFSLHLSSAIRSWLEGMSYSERERVIDIVFDVLEAGNVKTIRELKSNSAAILRVVRAASDMPPDDRMLLIELVWEFIRAAGIDLERIARITPEIMQFFSSIRHIFPKRSDNPALSDDTDRKGN